MARGLQRSMGAFSATVLISAFLLFQVQPIISKAILPWFGGSLAVWTTAMLFFQVLLLGGYAYAHLLTTRLSLRAQALVHGALLLLAAACLPILPDPAFKTGHGAPSLRVLLVLASAVGAPYFALSATGPLLQRWFSILHARVSPYQLYALSNAGSLCALLSYPTLFEPSFDIRTQAIVWSVGFAVFALGMVVCARSLWTYAPVMPQASLEQEHSERRVGASDYLLWFLLGLVPSALLLAATNELCVDVATVPLLWVVPLSIYLLSFTLCFGPRLLYRRNPFVLLWTLFTAGLCVELLDPTEVSLPRRMTLLLGTLATGAMLCHGELAQRKPEPRHLTAFYLTMSAGGAGGGLLVALVAPLVSTDYVEEWWWAQPRSWGSRCAWCTRPPMERWPLAPAPGP